MKSQSEPIWQSAAKLGLIGGAAAALCALIGMVETFNQRAIIGGVLSMGQTFLGLAVALSAYAAARRAQPDGPAAVVSAGAVAGLAAGLMIAALVLLMTVWTGMRTVFLNASPGLYALLTFGQSLPVALAIGLVGGAALGAATAALLLLGPALMGMIVSVLGTVLLVGVLADLLRLITSGWGGLGRAFTWLFAGRGLSIVGAIAVAAVVVLFSILRQRGLIKFRPAAQQRRSTRQTYLSLGITLAVLAVLPLVLGTYMSEVLDQIGLYVLMGLGLNIVVGFAGLLDLGYVGFYAIGAYVMGLLTSPELGFFNLSWWIALPVVVGVTILSGVILGIPVLKVRGDYLAIVTLGFGEMIRYLALSNALDPITGGPQGVQLIAKPTIGSFVFNDVTRLYYLLLAGCLLAGFIAIRLRDSRLGRAWMAMREDEDVAQAIGINLVSTKLLAFATGASFAGISGAIFAAKIGAAYPQSFHFLVSINVLALTIIGGMGSIPGVIVGALVLVGLPELLREFAEFRLLVYGVVLVVMMLYRPEGLLPSEAVRRELHEDENLAAEDAQSEPAEPGEPTIQLERTAT
jgi:branched-chain amino acid transport system permease protein